MPAERVRLERCVVHAGTHKTGTTTVQDLLAAHRPELAAAGIRYPALDPKGRDHNALAHRLATCRDDELPALADELARAAAEAGARRGDAATLLISAEELSTRICNPAPWEGFDDGAYWDHRRRFLGRVRRVLPQPASIEVFVCFRGHESYAHALYATKLLSGKVECSFGEFVRRCAPIFDYARQVDVLRESLGPVRVEGYERLRADLVNQVFARLGVAIRVDRTPRLNPTPTLDLIHWLSKAVQSPPGRSQRRQRAAFCRGYRPAPGVERPTFESLWQSPEERDEFAAACRPPPIDGWPPPRCDGPVDEAGALDRRAAQIEDEYRLWLRGGGNRRHWVFFWRRW